MDKTPLKHQVRVYNHEQIAPLLSSKKPFFTMSRGVYAVKLGKTSRSKGQDVPICFIRVDKDRTLPGRQRRKAIRAQREIARAAKA
jgi:hypothetical protein